MKNWNLPGEWELVIKKKKLKEKKTNHKAQQCWTMSISSCPETRHIRVDIHPFSGPPLPICTVGVVQSEVCRNCVAKCGLSPGHTTVLTQLWDMRLGTTLVQLIILQLSQSWGRAQGILQRKGRLGPHLILGCLLVIWLTGEEVILVKLSLVKSCFSERAVPGKGKMGLLRPQWHTLGIVVVNRPWGKPVKLLGIRTADWRSPEVGCLSCSSRS